MLRQPEQMYFLFQTNENDVPLYFRFMTIMAFNIFLEEKVDVAIVEVGIGGEYDCTNVIRFYNNYLGSQYVVSCFIVLEKLLLLA